MANPAMIRSIERSVVLASYLYYDGMGVESPWTDADFDGWVHFLATWEQFRTPEFAARLKAAGLKITTKVSSLNGLHYTPEEKADAIAWAKSGKFWPEEK